MYSANNSLKEHFLLLLLNIFQKAMVLESSERLRFLGKVGDINV